MQPNSIVLIIFTCLIVLMKLVGTFFLKTSRSSGRKFRLKTLLKKQPWLPAVLILITYLLELTLDRFNILHPFKSNTTYFTLLAGIGAMRAILSIWLFLAEASVFYKWLSQVIEKGSITHSLLPYIKNGIRYIFLVLSLPFVSASFPAYPQADEIIAKIIKLLVIWAIAWFIIQMIAAIEKVALQRLQVSLNSDFQARRIYTQARVFKRVVIVCVIILALAASTMVFDSVRELGTSLLASAGLATVILGLAAQKTLGNLFAGMQLAITQPIRMNDVISVENEFGTVEEITLSHVVLKIWDLRRLIIPINYFIEKPFQNFTRTSTQLLSPIFFYADYNLPMDKVREEFQLILKSSPFWDGEVATLQIAEAQDRMIKVRALASVQNSADAWNIKCEILEKLLAYIVKNHPESLPKTRSLTQVE